jgi:hypothetical protein
MLMGCPAVSALGDPRFLLFMHTPRGLVIGEKRLFTMEKPVFSQSC